jgi:hypothetical protein
MTTCQGLFGRLFGHNYQARFSTGSTPYPEVERATTQAVVAVMEVAKPRTYERDVCTRCGHTVEKR